MELNVYNIKGEDTGRTVTLDDAIFCTESNKVFRPEAISLLDTPNDHAIYLDVKQHLANKRQGTHKAKERSEVTGSTRKLGRQKGGGGARRGDIKSPVLVGGGRVFGPKPRDYSFKLNKKVKQLARKSALAYKIKNNELIIVEDFAFEAPKTKAFVDMIKNLKIADKKLLLVLPEQNKNVYLSARNLERAKVTILSGVNTYGILDASRLLFTEKALAGLIENLKA
ncbi:MAG: 50S ribosomal protein L4 [Bacteroidales bacterium]|jgi:large subunit ribosomal protein L4|nr:50S ribosomal protein L4 [Bacteroidales bacterium]